MLYKKDYRDLIIMDSDMKHEWNDVRKDLKNHPEKIMNRCKNPVEKVRKSDKNTKCTHIDHAVQVRHV